jgi:signal transduction histidine kinase
MLNNLSYRVKTPAALVLVILVTAISVSSLWVWQGWSEARRTYETHAENLGRVLAQTLRPALMHDNVWQAYEILVTPLEKPQAGQRDFILVDTQNRIFSASDPKHYPVLAPFSFGPDPTPTNRDQPKSVERPPFLYLYTPVVSEDGRVIGQLIQRHDLSVLKPRFAEVALRVSYVTLTILVILLPLGWLAGKRLTGPLSHLAGCLARVGRENPEAIRCEFPDGSDEISMLAKSFHGMVDELKAKQALEKHLAQSDRLAALGRLSAGIAHEVNNPLGGMLNAISNHRRAGDIDPRTEKTLSLIERGLTQIRATVSALLVEARLELRALSPADIEDVRTLVAADVQSNHLQLEWTNALTEPVPLPSAQVRQILLNLLLNAVHASPEGGQVSVAAWPDTGRLILTVGNAGPAIPARRREHLFEPYFGEGEGHGLGLWVTYQLVQQLSGKIEVDSVPGHTRFTVILPLDEDYHAA